MFHSPEYCTCPCLCRRTYFSAFPDSFPHILSFLSSRFVPIIEISISAPSSSFGPCIPSIKPTVGDFFWFLKCCQFLPVGWCCCLSCLIWWARSMVFGNLLLFLRFHVPTRAFQKGTYSRPFHKYLSDKIRRSASIYHIPNSLNRRHYVMVPLTFSHRFHGLFSCFPISFSF